MTFTELEYVLMIAVAVLLWRNSALNKVNSDAVDAANKYANFLIRVGKGEGTVVKDKDGSWTFKPKEKHQ